VKRLVTLLLCATAIALAAPSVATAQEAAKLAEKKLPRRKAAIASFKSWAVMTVSWRDAVNDKIRRKLLSGLPTTIVARAYVFGEDDEQPVSLSVKSCRVVFDLWDEVFRIELVEAGRKRHSVAVNVEGVLRQCADARRLPLSSIASLDAKKSYFVGVLVEVNPLSKEMMDRIKRWVSRPRGAGAVGPGDSLFGSFVGLFVTHVPDADRVVAFRTQSFVPAALPLIVEPKKEGERSELEDAFEEEDERGADGELDLPELPGARPPPEMLLWRPALPEAFRFEGSSRMGPSRGPWIRGAG
jgi:hypothetical protein